MAIALHNFVDKDEKTALQDVVSSALQDTLTAAVRYGVLPGVKGFGICIKGFRAQHRGAALLHDSALGFQKAWGLVLDV
jgi:ligand-binding SRPBCC domain-containing protein